MRLALVQRTQNPTEISENHIALWEILCQQEHNHPHSGPHRVKVAEKTGNVCSGQVLEDGLGGRVLKMCLDLAGKRLNIRGREVASFTPLDRRRSLISRDPLCSWNRWTLTYGPQGARGDLIPSFFFLYPAASILCIAPIPDLGEQW